MVTCELMTSCDRSAVLGTTDQNDPVLASSFLASLAGVACVAEELKNPAKRAFAYALISAAEANLSDERDFLQVHYYLGATGIFFYRFRKLDNFGLERAISAFQRQIQISSEVAGLLRAASRENGLGHAGYSHMRLIREVAGELDAARSICVAALEGGWQGDWRGHIRRIDAKLMANR